MGNPRRVQGYRRDQLRKRIASLGLPCSLCGRPIDYTLTTYVDPKDGKRKPHPMRYELDEIIPISKGGSHIDPENVQPTHRICNQRRGNKPIPKKPSEPARDPLPKSRDWLA